MYCWYGLWSVDIVCHWCVNYQWINIYSGLANRRIIEPSDKRYITVKTSCTKRIVSEIIAGLEILQILLFALMKLTRVNVHAVNP